MRLVNCELVSTLSPVHTYSSQM